MLKSFVIFCILFSLSCAFPAETEEDSPMSNGESDSISTTEVEVVDLKNSDEDALKKIDELIQVYKATIPSSDYFSYAIATIIMKSLDKNCMLDEYKTLGIENRLPKFPPPGHTSIDFDKNIMRMMIFSGIGFLCSTKRNAILEFSFDSMATFQPLVKAFINETELKNYNDMLVCANNYAVQNEIIDPNLYNIQYELTEDNQEQCKQWKIRIIGEIEAISNSIMNPTSTSVNGKSEVIECGKQSYENGIKFFLKYSPIFQVELKEKQKHDLITKFIEDYKSDVHASMACFAKFT
jgi:hypothetical protein